MLTERKLGLGSVRVQKKELLETLKTNRTKHETEFLDAVVGYRTAIVKELSRLRTKANKATDDELVDLNISVSLSRPQNHVRDYDLAIKMLEWSIDDHVDLDQHEFNQYVNDEWHWSAGFKAVTSFYSK